MNDIIFETERLIARKVVKSDTENIFEINSDPEAMTFFPSIMSKEENSAFVNRILEKYEADGESFWAVILKSTGEFVGLLGILHQDVEGVKEFEIAYRFVRRFWNRGYATEAAIGCRKYAFEKLSFKRVVSLIDPENIASQRVAAKNSMTYEKMAIWKGERVRVYFSEREFKK